MNEDGSNLQVFQYPGYPRSGARHGNDAGAFAGSYYSGGSSTSQAFYYDSAGFHAIAIPGATISSAEDINNFGVVAGGYHDATGDHGYIYANGVITTVDAPGATATSIYGMNDLGQLSGAAVIDGVQHGIILTPESIPEPGGIMAMTVGLIATFAPRTLRRKRLHPSRSR
jgi:hypothetical protein